MITSLLRSTFFWIQGRWNDQDCEDRNHYICKQMKQNLGPTQFPITPSGCNAVSSSSLSGLTKTVSIYCRSLTGEHSNVNVFCTCATAKDTTDLANLMCLCCCFWMSSITPLFGFVERKMVKAFQSCVISNPNFRKNIKHTYLLIEGSIWPIKDIHRSCIFSTS